MITSSTRSAATERVVLPDWADPRSVAGRAVEAVLPLWDDLVGTLDHPATLHDPAPMPEPAIRWLDHALPRGTIAARAVVLEMTGHIKVGRWIPLRAVQLIVPPHGFVWAARAGWGPASITGFDSYGHDEGRMRWSIGGRIPIVDAQGPDVTRSAADRLALDSVWLPQSFVGLDWDDADDGAVAVREVGDEQARVELRVAADGHLTSVRMQRWAAPDKGPWARHPCGGYVGAEATFDGVTIPSEVSVGYWIDSSQWNRGEFFRCQVTNAVFLP